MSDYGRDYRGDSSAARTCSLLTQLQTIAIDQTAGEEAAAILQTATGETATGQIIGEEEVIITGEAVGTRGVGATIEAADAMIGEDVMTEERVMMGAAARGNEIMTRAETMLVTEAARVMMEMVGVAVVAGAAGTTMKVAAAPSAVFLPPTRCGVSALLPLPRSFMSLKRRSSFATLTQQSTTTLCELAYKGTAAMMFSLCKRLIDP